MTTVVKFPKTKNRPKRNAILDVTRRAVNNETLRYRFFPWFWRALIGTGWFLLESIRTIALMFLLWLRPILFFVIRPLSGFLMIAFIVCLFTHPNDTRVTWGFGLLTFGAFMVMYLYDWLIMVLSGGNAIHILN